MTRDRVAVVDQSRLVSSARVRDGFYSTFVVRRLSRHVTRWALRLGLRPNEVTLASLVIALVAAALFSRGQTWTTVLAAVLLQVSLVVDCVDGEVARYTGRFTAVGAWLDGVGDRLKEYAVYAGLAAGYHAWALAGAMLVLQVFRHHVDFGFAATVPASDASRADEQGLSVGRRAVALSETTSERPALMWAKRVVIMPIGERWLVLSVVSVARGGRATFAVLLALCSVAAAYTTAGRVLRALSRSASLADADSLSVMTALAPPPADRLPAALLGLRLVGILPALVRAAELATLLVVTAHHAPGVLPSAYALAMVVALDGYDLVYRLRTAGAAPARWRQVALLGAAPRLAVELLVVLGLGAHAGPALVALAAVVALVGVAEVSGWLRSAGSQP